VGGVRAGAGLGGGWARNGLAFEGVVAGWLRATRLGPVTSPHSVQKRDLSARTCTNWWLYPAFATSDAARARFFTNVGLRSWDGGRRGRAGTRPGWDRGRPGWDGCPRSGSYT
jgi:hypothetical protein